MTATATTPAADRRIWNPVQRDAATFVETTQESGGARTVLVVEVAPGGGNDPHRHLTYAERFEALEGELTVQVGEATLRLGPGERATAAPNTSHCFRNETGAAVTFRVTLEPGHRGFEQALQIAYGLAADGRVRPDGVPKDVRIAGLLAAWSDIRVDGRMRFLNPVVGVLARMARRRGLDRELLARYVTI